MRFHGIAVLIFALITPSCSHSEENKVDCVFTVGDVCRVPFDLIFSRKNDLLNRKIVIQGILSKEGEEVVFYPDFESARFLIRERSILLIDSSGSYFQDVDYLNGKRVMAVGVLSQSRGNNWAEMSLESLPREVPIVVDDQRPKTGIPTD